MATGSNGASTGGSGALRVTQLLESAIRDIGIPPCPVILDRINAEMHKDEPDFNHLAQIIGSDVGLAASLISIANSSYFGLRNRVRSVNEALMMLGLDVASHAIAGLILRKLFPAIPVLERFWDASACIARLSGWLAQQGGIGIKIRPDDAYTFGLFRDCGIAVLLKRYTYYQVVLKEANNDEKNCFTDIEERVFPTNHAVIGCLLAQSWYLPEEICLAIRHHHDYPVLSGQSRTATLPVATLGLIAVAQFAENLVQHHTGLCQTREWPKAGAACLHLLGIADKGLARLYAESATVIAAKE